MNLFFAAKAFADTATTTAVPVAPQPPTMMEGLMQIAPPLVLMAAVIYFLMIRPQQNKLKEQEQMVSKLQKGEEVITRAGIIGKIHGIADKFVTLEVDQNVRIKVLKNQIEMVLRGEQKV